MAHGFTRAFRKARLCLNKTPAAEVARAEQSFFLETDMPALERCIAAYQQLGCWTPQIEIIRAALEATLDIFAYNGLITERFDYERVCTSPPEG